jgi:hypothetical protein
MLPKGPVVQKRGILRQIDSSFTLQHPMTNNCYIPIFSGFT